MNKDFIESLKGLSESEIEKKLEEEGWSRASVPSMMASESVSRVVLPQGSQMHKEVLILDYSLIRPKQYDLHQCYAIFIRK